MRYVFGVAAAAVMVAIAAAIELARVLISLILSLIWILLVVCTLLATGIIGVLVYAGLRLTSRSGRKKGPAKSRPEHNPHNEQ